MYHLTVRNCTEQHKRCAPTLLAVRVYNKPERAVKGCRWI
jgi:hypothetical protein